MKVYYYIKYDENTGVQQIITDLNDITESNITNGIILEQELIVNSNSFIMINGLVFVEVEFIEPNIFINAPIGCRVFINSYYADKEEEVPFAIGVNEGYKLDTITGVEFDDIIGSHYSFTKGEEDTHITIKLKKIDYDIIFNESTHGSISTDKNIAQVGDIVIFKAKPEEGYKLSYTYPNMTKVDEETYTYKMPAHDIIIFATFVKDDYVVNVSELQHGRIEINLIDSKAQMGDTIHVIVKPEFGYELDTISGAELIANGDQFYFIMPAKNVTINATFKQTLRNIRINEPLNGQITSDKFIANEGETVTLTFKPDYGYLFQKITGVGYTRISNYELQFVVGKTDIEISATFVKIHFIVFSDKVANGESYPDKFGVTNDELVTVKVKPNKGYELDKLTKYSLDNNNEHIDLYTGSAFTKVDDETYTFITGTYDTFINASFKKKNYNVKFNNSNGTVKVDKPIAQMGDVVTITIIPNNGYELDVSKLRYTKISDTKYSFVMPANDVNISYPFKKKQYSVNIAKSTNGTIKTTKTKFQVGETVTLTITPNKGYELDRLTGTDFTKVNETTYTFKMNNSNVNIIATFKRKIINVSKEFENIKINVSGVADSFHFDKYTGDIIIDSDQLKIISFDLRATKLEGSVKIIFELGTEYNGHAVILYNQKSLNDVEKMKSIVKYGKASFEVDTLSPFVLSVEEVKETKNNEKTKKTSTYIVLGLAVIVAIGMPIIVKKSKKK